MLLWELLAVALVAPNRAEDIDRRIVVVLQFFVVDSAPLNMVCYTATRQGVP